MDRAKALDLLSECDGKEIWSVEYCRQRGVPHSWIEDLADGFESGFRSERDTIYEEGKVAAQYEGILASELAIKLGEYLGLNTNRIRSMHSDREALVRAIIEAVEDGDD